MSNKEYSIPLGDKTLTLRFTNWAEQANASVVAQYGDTVVLTTVVMSDEDKDMPYFPLTVEYREKYYAAGFIGGGRFHKREGRPSSDATIKARMIDRTIRPLFNHGIRRDVQVVNTILSYDKEATPDIVALIATSAALHTSNIPWNGPVGAARIGTKEEEWQVNPPIENGENIGADIVVTGTESKVNMIEVGAQEMPEEKLVEGMKIGQEHVEKVVSFINNIREEIGREKTEIEVPTIPEEVKTEIRQQTEDKLREIIFEKNTVKTDDEIVAIKHATKEHLKEKYEENPAYIDLGEEYLEELVDELVHEAVLTKEKRVDGRKLDEVRPLSAHVATLPRTHGSGLFMRGLTHALSTVTLDTPGEEELSEEMEGEEKKRFMHHYNFPPYSTGEASPFRGPGRREIGHGALAEKALAPIVPPKEEFPYVIRAVTEILSSNGSSSMASVCGSSLALMDAGVPIKKHIAGIAMGLVEPPKNSENDTEPKILTDIQGPEDHYGDMDFKVAGTRDGVTAIQMDVKIEGVDITLLEKGLEQAKKARLEILDLLENTISAPRENVSQYAPVINFIQINTDRIGLLIGAGGSTIKDIMAETNTEISVEDDGSVYISGVDKKEVEEATELVHNVTREIKVGEVFDAKVVKIADFGAFVELVPGQEALVHISELKDDYVNNVEDVVKTGDRLKVKVIKIDDQGKISASAKEISETEKESS